MDGTSRIDELEQKFIENPRRYFAPLANEYRKAGNPHQAIAICRAHLSQLPSHMSGQIVYGQALFAGGEYDEARTVFENALAMDRENLVALKHLGDLSLRDGETAAARQWYGKLLEIDPNDATVVALVNEIDAATEAQPPAATDVDQTGAEAAHAVTEESATAPAEVATEPATQAPEPDPFHSEEEDNLLSEELGYPVPPPQAFVTETMAELYLAQGFRDRAVNVLQQLVALRPDDERLRSRLAELDASAAPEAEVEEPPLIEARRDESISEATPESPPPEVPPLEVEPPAEFVAAPMSVREFFASIGRRRPSSRANGSADGEEDARAAAALAGAFGHFGAAASPSPDTQASLAAATGGKESEEDVATFRAWLDGLTG